jgi:hypothetical protein
MASYLPNQLYQGPLAELQADPTQPCKYMDPAALDEMTASVGRDGIIEPVVCREDAATGLCRTAAGGAGYMKCLRAVWAMVLLVFMLSLHACGGGGSGSGGATGGPAVSGVAAAGAPIIGQVTLRDKNGVELGPVATDSSGNFSFDVTGLALPFILKADGWVGAQSYTLYSAATTAGKAHINPFTHLVLAAAAGVDPSQVFGPAGGRPDTAAISDSALRAALVRIHALMQPLLDEYGITDFDPLGGDYEANPGNRLDAMLDLIRVEFNSGSITIANKLNGSVIASGNLANLAAISLDKARAPAQSSLAEIREITARLTELCSVMDLGADLTVQVLDGFFIPDPQYGLSNGHARTEDIASIPAIFGPGGTNTRGRVKEIRNVRLVSDITADYYASRGIERVFILNYDFIHENGDIVRGTNVTFARETGSGLWKFIGDPDLNNGGNTSNYGFVCNYAHIDYLVTP